ncbi:hypothetical protein IMY05_003G0073800 [Salix suchowensis]|nr:hypothetical protein IMY05_003G0073800 [Salix suchowensis]
MSFTNPRALIKAQRNKKKYMVLFRLYVLFLANEPAIYIYLAAILSWLLLHSIFHHHKKHKGKEVKMNLDSECKRMNYSVEVHFMLQRDY